MVFNSIRWRLQLWHGLVLFLVLAGFGITARQLDRTSRFQRIDRELQQRAGLISNALRRGEPRPDQDRGGNPPPNGDEHRGAPRADGEEFPRLPPRGDPSSPDGERMPEGGLPLSQGESAEFDGTGANAFYYILWRRDGEILSKSRSAPANATMPVRERAGPFIRTMGYDRESVTFTPPGEAIVVGCDLQTEYAEMRRLSWLLFGAGGAVLLLGLAGGWWMSSRVIRPIADISATAAKISHGDLAQRIPPAADGSELGTLVEILNSTFARLEGAFDRQRQFTSDAAHELRTPVSVLLTQIQSALNRERTPAQYRESLEACQRAAQRMRRLIEALLSMARLDAGQESFEREPLDLARVAADCVELVGPLARERSVTVESSFAPAQCKGDADRLALVITNLLTNAIHHNKVGGHVHISTANGSGAVTLTVQDDGPGIAPEHLAHVFERFYRGDPSRTNTAGRSGLGLAISKAIVEAHGGAIKVRSQPGAGAKFTVTLPAT